MIAIFPLTSNVILSMFIPQPKDDRDTDFSYLLSENTESIQKMIQLFAKRESFVSSQRVSKMACTIFMFLYEHAKYLFPA